MPINLNQYRGTVGVFNNRNPILQQGKRMIVTATPFQNLFDSN